MHLPQFSGSYESWPGFSDSFKSAVHDNPSFRDTQKLIYLRSCLSGKALEKIESLETTAANYLVAWNILEKYYDDPTSVINNRVKAFFQLKSINRGTSESIGEILDEANKHYRALKALNKPFLEAFPIYAIISKLDDQSRLKWKEQSKCNALPTMDELLDFLHSRQKILEAMQFERNNPEKSTSNNVSQSRGPPRQSAGANRTSLNYANQMIKPYCYLCKGNHYTQNCEKLTSVDIDKRHEVVKNAKLCFNCLRSNHLIKACTSANCKVCNGKHNTILHRENRNFNQSNQEIVNVQSVQANVVNLKANTGTEVLLATAVVNIFDKKGNPQSCRVFIDSCSQSNFISRRMASKLNLEQIPIEISIGGVNNAKSRVKNYLNATVKSRLNEFTISGRFLLVDEVADLQPARHINKDILKIPSNIHLADPGFHRPAEIDALIGAEHFYRLLCVGQFELGAQSTILQKTQFGWIISGNVPTKNIKKFSTCNLSLNTLNERITKFWEIEEAPSKKLFSNEEIACEQHYRENTNRNPVTGRYTVKLPFKNRELELGESYTTALKRFYSLEKSFERKPEVKKQYVEFIKEYEELGHMSEDINPSKTMGYYMPHHPVIKDTSLTTKLRTVFDGSAKTSNNISLNESLMVGPTIQEDLISILVRFRSHIFVVIADMAKMYRQIEIDGSDRKFQKILWRDNPSKPIKTYNLKTVTYGVSSSSFLATRTLKQLADDESKNYPQASIILKEDFYVDDLLTGTSTFEEAMTLIPQLVNISAAGGFQLRQWATNESELLKSITETSENAYLRLDKECTTKTLGICWKRNTDKISFIVNKNEQTKKITKRNVLSEIAKLFDPLGLSGPVVVKAKLIMQQLWQLKIDWDQSLPMSMHTAWTNYHSNLSLLNNLEFDRGIIIKNCIDLQMHCFSDASEKAYGAVIYLRSVDEKGRCISRLLCSKSRVAPLKSVSLPRLELCAALLAAILFESSIQALRHLKFSKIIFWSDSTIVLHWISTPAHTLKTFVSNRVAKIQNKTSGNEWRHVKSEQNPADLVSRGLDASEIVQNQFWQCGPEWLSKDEKEWPISKLEIIEIPEQRSVTVAANVNTCTLLAFFQRFESYSTMKRVMAYCLRFINNAAKRDKISGHLSTSEIKAAESCLLKMAQTESFSDILQSFKSGGQIMGKTAPLSPILDSEGIIRVGGRISKSDLPYYQKHPILIPVKHKLTTLIIREHHVKNYHAGAQATLNSIRKSFWIIDGRNVVRNVIRRCVICRKAKPEIPSYVMGNLPKNRLVYKRPFLICGVDYCGPFYIKEKRHRNRNKIKVYVAVFVCFSTKAVHIEIVSDLSTNAFLAALKRFFARRGRCTDIYSDNATNFQGAKREIDEIYKFLKIHNDTIVNTLSDESVNWHFIPPSSPHFGGLWEAAVKSLKYHMTRVVGDAILNYEDLLTFVTEIEAILNSRPLTSISSDPNDLSALTPSHFLIGDTLTSIPEHDLSELSPGRLSSWQHVQQMRQHFWNRWYNEYLHEQIMKAKWYSGSTKDIGIGTLVTIKEDNVPPMRWPLGRIIAIHPDDEGVIRVVTVKTARGEYKRSVKKISPLPLNYNQ